ncbi:MAG: hypothetical protein KGJ23_08085 [Euryarchaeota archaeon]|nr:hypothetical protein [Euryarchaeota archaeon]MDE1836560.1 hypothetical protein [Euryarchaeota archaeon]MDE1879245.1 hypothetical protein [Euryarchaeota archaeon]MDE2044530.1 hypothetical protein [Thermoplasmata archaeon]
MMQTRDPSLVWVERIRDNLRVELVQEVEQHGECPYAAIGETCGVWTWYVAACDVTAVTPVATGRELHTPRVASGEVA